MTKPLTFAVPKGRILDEALPVMARAGIVPAAEFHDKKNRALSFAAEGSDRMDRIAEVVAKHWPEAIAPGDLASAALVAEVRQARAALLDALGLGELN